MQGAARYTDSSECDASTWPHCCASTGLVTNETNEVMAFQVQQTKSQTSPDNIPTAAAFACCRTLGNIKIRQNMNTEMCSWQSCNLTQLCGFVSTVIYVYYCRNSVIKYSTTKPFPWTCSNTNVMNLTFLVFLLPEELGMSHEVSGSLHDKCNTHILIVIIVFMLPCLTLSPILINIHLVHQRR